MGSTFSAPDKSELLRQTVLEDYVNTFRNVCLAVEGRAPDDFTPEKAIQEMFDRMMTEEEIDHQDLKSKQEEQEKEEADHRLQEEEKLKAELTSSQAEEIVVSESLKKLQEDMDYAVAVQLRASQEQEIWAGMNSDEDDCQEVWEEVGIVDAGASSSSSSSSSSRVPPSEKSEIEIEDVREKLHHMELRMSQNSAGPECPVCMMPYEEDEPMGRVAVLQDCNHRVSCVQCFLTYLKVRISEQDVVPWIRCPEKNCKRPVHPKDLVCTLPKESLCQFVQILMDKRLHQEKAWYSCNKEGCKFGFLIFDEKKALKSKVDFVCDICHTAQASGTVLQKGTKEDSSYKDLIKDGVLRPCPKCKYMAMKDFGICNIIQCGHCSIWWNWRTRETGTTRDKLKNLARKNNTLWEPGELEFQQNLEQNDKAAFKKLLKDNGIRYNPFYIRGH